MDSAIASKTDRRLAIIEGQLRGVRRMLDEQSPCMDVLTQIAAIQKALRKVGRLVVDNHLRTCVTTAIKAGRGEEHYDELLSIMDQLNK
ncbi:MAG: metal-sensitive transcriptional regulator [Planctomycetota bacterium]|nr:metal-sensitive transcriptional regulator [Planctomycetota bacterium]